MTQDDGFITSFLNDKAEQCLSNQMITHSAFLDLRGKSAAACLRLPHGVHRVFYGGFAGAERCVAVYLPEYIEACDFGSLSEFFAESPDDCPVCALGVKKDKFSPPLSHRDYLGSLMGLGISRDMTGDIIVNDDGCVIFVMKSLSAYIAENLSSAGRGTLTVSILAPHEVTGLAGSEGVRTTFTVSSPRLDSIVKNGFRIGREAACEAIGKGLVFINDVECTKPDRRVAEGDKITLRHKGRLIVTGFPGRSKKGREIVETEFFGKS